MNKDLEKIFIWLQYVDVIQGKIFQDLGNLQKAENSTRKAIKLKSDCISAHITLGEILLDLNKPKEALASYKLNLELRPFRFNGIYGAAKAAEKLEDIKLARYYYNQLIELTSDVNSSRPEINEAKDFLTTNSMSIADNG